MESPARLLAHLAAHIPAMRGFLPIKCALCNCRDCVQEVLAALDKSNCLVLQVRAALA